MVEMLALTGKAIEGDVLTAVEVIPKSEIQQRVWNKYKNDVCYQWYFHVIHNLVEILNQSLKFLIVFFFMELL